jgi:hypothetical protein
VKNHELGPGYLLFDLHPTTGNQTLTLATYPFSGTCNPKIPVVQLKWVALIEDYNYLPFLAKRFTKAQWFKLFPEGAKDNLAGNVWLLGLLPIDSFDPKTLERWIRADKAFRDLIWLSVNTVGNRNRDELFRGLAGLYPAVQGDPLLESLYWEMVFDFHSWENIYGDKNTAVHYPAGFSAIQNALRNGYPTAYFYNELGGFLALQKDYLRARQAFLKAIHSKVNYTSAEYNLKALEQTTGLP